MEKRNLEEDDVNCSIVTCMCLIGAITVAAMVFASLEILVFPGTNFWLQSMGISFLMGPPSFCLLQYSIPRYLKSRESHNMNTCVISEQKVEMPPKSSR